MSRGADGHRGEPLQFDGRVAFITGAAVGFGRSFARSLGERGAAVVLADIDEQACRRTAQTLAEEGIRAVAVRCDVADEGEVDDAVGVAAERFGGIDILINNAGRHLTKYNQSFSTLTRAELRGLFDVNVMGVINCTLSAQPVMRQRPGAVVLNIASIAAYLHVSPYAVSKLAVRGLTAAFATELAPDGIRVNAIAPGLVDTENALADLPQSLVDEFVDQRQRVHRLGGMTDVVSAMLFFARSRRRSSRARRSRSVAAFRSDSEQVAARAQG